MTADQVRQFDEDGYLLLPSLLNAQEVGFLLECARTDPTVEGQALLRSDGEGGTTRLRIWNQAGDDPYGTVARLPRIVEPMEQFLRGEVYFYHAKLTLKEPYTGGAWAWHQDYGYWYNNGCLFPYMASCMVALEPATRENGCLQVLRGSHLMGRIDHGKVGEQTGADPQRVQQAQKVCPVVYCEMEPGDALFFHCNLLHRSDQNRSPQSRWMFLCCYNAARNDPYKEHHHPRYHKLIKTSPAALQELLARRAPGRSPETGTGTTGTPRLLPTER